MISAVIGRIVGWLTGSQFGLTILKILSICAAVIVVLFWVRRDGRYAERAAQLDTMLKETREANEIRAKTIKQSRSGNLPEHLRNHYID